MVRQTVLRVTMLAGLAVATLAATSACGSDPAAPAAPTQTAPGSVADPANSANSNASTGPSASAPAGDAERIGPTGIGPLVLAATVAQLQASGAITNVQPVAQCPDWSTADGTGDLSFVHVAFSKGTLAWIEASTTSVSTVDGAQLGMALDEVSGMYGARGVELTNAAGEKALGVPGPAKTGLLLRTSAEAQVNVIEAGTYDLLTRRFTEGKGC